MGLVEKLRRIAAPRAAPAVSTLSDELPGAEREGPDGPFWVRVERFPLRHVHGGHSLEKTATAPASCLAQVAREPSLGDLDFTRALFFDTETTSLSGGVGTYVFLFGAGFFQDDHFVVEQYFLRAMTEERALLSAIARRLEAFDLAVSFHGKGFDAPRLHGRFTFHRLPIRFPAAHLDLCIVGRSLYRGAFEDCRLQTFERELVGFRRADDLPGALCPPAFFNHLQGDSTLIPRVFEHNLYDVLTLPVVAALFAREVSAPDHPVVLANLGSFHESSGRNREARASYERALAGLRVSTHPLLARVLERLALLERRAGRHTASASLLLERKDLHPFSLDSLEDLAKYYEHRRRDLRSAEETALDARSRLVTGKVTLDTSARTRRLRSLDHRLDRLRRRQGGSSLS